MKRVAVAMGLALTSLAAEAQAQVGVGAAGDVTAGIEGGGTGYAAGVRRTRSTLRFGLDLWLEEWPNNIIAFAALVEIEPAASFGADLRYERRVADDFIFHLGGTVIIVPNYMIGGTFGVAYRLDVTEMIELNFGPTGNIYFYGDDLPKDRLLWQVVAGVGVRIAF